MSSASRWLKIHTRHWRPCSRYALSPEATLITSPKSEEGVCDTDVQTLSDGSKNAHGAKMPKHMLVL